MEDNMKLDEILGISHQIVESVNLISPSPKDVINLIDSLNVTYVIIGAHGISVYLGKIRATIDIDIVTDNIDIVKNAIESKWPELEIVECPSKITFISGKYEIIDLIKPSQPIYKLVLNNCVANIPTLEMSLVLKYAAMISPNRKPDEKTQDAADFKIMVLKNDRIDIDKIKDLTRLSNLYDDAHNEIAQLILDIRNGKTINI